MLISGVLFMGESGASSTASSATVRWLGVAAILVIIFGVPAFLDQGEPPRIQFGWELLEKVEKAAPRVILIGDSMLETRIDPGTLNGLSKEPWYVLAQPGGSSAVWYLMMKNFVSELPDAPHSVIIFFRDRQLTLPSHNTGSGYKKTVQRYMSGDEPRVESLVFSAEERDKWWLEQVADKLYPVQLRRDDAHDSIQFRSLDLVASSREYGKIRQAAASLFDLGNLRDDRRLNAASNEEASLSLDAPGHRFEDSVADSFLPDLISMAKAKKIQLIFYRVKRRTRAKDPSLAESPSYSAYKTSLQRYLDEHGVRLYDESADADVVVDFYTNDDHVAANRRKPYTKLFWSKIKPVVRPTTAPAVEGRAAR